MDNTVFMNNIFLIFNRIISILLLIFGLYFFWIVFSFIFLGAVFYGGGFAILIDLLLELSLISIWIFSYSFINQFKVINKEADTAKDVAGTDAAKNKKADAGDRYMNQYKEFEAINKEADATNTADNKKVGDMGLNDDF